MFLFNLEKKTTLKSLRDLRQRLLCFQKKNKATFFGKPTRKPLDAGATKVLDMDTWPSIRPEAN
jgi:hypothetical protein